MLFCGRCDGEAAGDMGGRGCGGWIVALGAL